MSWPADGRPRYKPVSGGVGVFTPGEDWRPIGYVLDRGRCHWPVVAIRHKVEGVALRKATEAAAVLNAGGTL